MSGRLNFEYGFNTNTAQLLDDDTPMRVYFLGDFTGTKAATENSSINKIVKIDIDNFDDVMVKLSPSVSLPSGHFLTFNELEDFHPDNIFEHAIFKNLRRLKRELNNSTTAENAAKEIVSSYQLNSESSPQVNDDNHRIDPASKETEDNSDENKDEVFERLLGQKQSTPISSTTTTTSNAQTIGNLDRFLGELLSPHIIKDMEPKHKSLIMFIDTALEELMKSILHAREFQTLESAWRSVRDVVFNETYNEANQFFYLVNTDRDALNSAVAGDSSFVTKLNQHIKNTDVESYHLLVGNYQFSATKSDVCALNYLATIAETLNCQFMGAADDSLIDANTDSLWQKFRQIPQASHIALSYPQVLLRLPYGKQHDEIDAFSFEEFSQRHQHHQLLWGNSAFACARLLIRQYHAEVNSQENGKTKFDVNITELPAFVYSEDGEKKLQACGEYLLSEQQLIDIRNQGVMVFASYRNKNCIRLFGDGIYAVNTQ
ncbi:MAG: type VI secretion system contractile sheath large subunit [Colwellia sp.]|nr:type VI secretion system contractile sheath large subunit [Colwellia sp.]